MTDRRWKDFLDGAAEVGLYPKELDYKLAYTTTFVNKKHAMEAAR